MSSEPLDVSDLEVDGIGPVTDLQYLRPREVAHILGVSPSEVSRLIKSKELPHILLRTSTRQRNGKEILVRHVRVARDDLLAFLKSKRVERVR